MADKRSRTWYCGQCLTTFEGEIGLCPNLGCRSPRPSEGWGLVYDSSDIIDRHYRVIRRLATGGAGITYLAREIGSEGVEEGVELAVKVLYANRDHGSYLRRLSQEAQILQELAHPNIVEYRGFVHRTGHSPYLVTRFEKGGSLLDHVRRRGALSIREASLVCCQVLAALDRAHQVGVVHRDLKPENVLLEQIPEPGQIPDVRVADFGIAKVSGLFSDRLTRVGAFVGTPQFAAPEQFDGLPPSPATDIFAVGGLLYFCITRQPLLPFGDRMEPEEARDLLVSRLPPKIKKADEDPKLVLAIEEVLASAMADAPEARVSARAMERMLQAVAEGGEIIRPGPTMIPTDEGIKGLVIGLSQASAAGAGAAQESPAAGPLNVARVVPSGRAPGEPQAPQSPQASSSETPASSNLPAKASAPPKKKRGILRWGCTLLVLGLLCTGVLTTGVLAALGILNLPSIPGLPDLGASKGTLENPRVLTGHESDPDLKGETKAILAYSKQNTPSLARACNLQERLLVDFTIDGKGAVIAARPQVMSPVGICAQQQALKWTFPRTESDIVLIKLPINP